MIRPTGLREAGKKEGGAVPMGSDQREVLGALAGAGLAALAVVTLLPVLLPMESPGPAPAVPSPDPEPAVDVAPALGPRFDTVRVAPDGSGLVAGRAEPGVTVSVLAGSEVAAEATADADGRFVAFLDLPPSAEPRALSLRDGAGGQSEETVILAPTGGGSPEAETAFAAGETTAEAFGQAGTIVPDLPTAGLALADAAPERIDPGAPATGGETPAATATEAPDVATASPVTEDAGPLEPGPQPLDGSPGMASPAEDGPAPAAEQGAPTLEPPAEGVSGQVAALVSDAEGVRVLQPALPPGADAEVLGSVALDAITYGGGGDVTLSGRAEGGGTVRLYLDNAPVAEAPVDPGGEWSTDLTGTQPGVHTLRVDQLDETGEVVSRIETPFQRETGDDLAAAMAEAQEAGQGIVMRTVQPGNTLWAIARDRYGEPMMYVQVFEMNRGRIRDPDLIYPGQVFVLPAREGR